MDLTVDFARLAGIELAHRGPDKRYHDTSNTTNSSLSLHLAFARAEGELLSSLRNILKELDEHGLAYSLVNDQVFNLSATRTSADFGDAVKRDLGQVNGTLEVLKEQTNAQMDTLAAGHYRHHQAILAQLNHHASHLANRLQQLETARRRQQQLQRAFALNDVGLLPKIPSTRIATLRRRHHNSAETGLETRQGLWAPVHTKTSDEGKVDNVDSHDKSVAMAVNPSDSPLAWEEVTTAVDNMDSSALAALAKQHQLVAPEITGMLREVNQAENTMYELARLQAQLSSKVAEQDVQISHIAQDTLATLENVEAGNTELAEAIQYNRDFRWGMLLFFLVLCITLLVLDQL
eukprot:m.264851 g.264851  ORF g.264851 m.264851 type:complete len:348 (+) comp17625_c0_seq11:1611-2654(+)